MYLSRTTILLVTASLIIALLWKCNAVNPPQLDKPVDTTHWTNKAGKPVTSLTGREDAFSVRGKIADSLARVYGTRIKYMQEYIVAMQHSQTDLKPVDSTKAYDYLPGDSCPHNVRQTFKNPWYTANVQIGDSSYMHLEHRDTLTAIWRKKGKILQLDLSNADTTNKITGVQAYRYKVPNRRWGIGVSAGYGVLLERPTSPSPFIGLGISYSFIKF